MGDLTDSVTPSSETHRARPMPVREDCWSEEATSTLIDAWGRRYLELNRGNLRQKDWQEVADAVNALHGHSKKTHRTDVQCKNRIDTIKKKYKIEKARVVSSNGTLASSWVFFDRVDMLVGPCSSAKKTGSSSPSVAPRSPPMALPLPYKKTPSLPLSPRPLATVLPQKRPADRGEEGLFRRNYSAMAAAAAAAEAEDEEEEEEEPQESDEEEEEEESPGIRKLAKAIENFGEVYQRVEAEKWRQMLDLEKQRMEFAKDLEMQRLKMFMDTQVQLERIRHSKRSRSDSDDIYGSE